VNAPRRKHPAIRPALRLFACAALTLSVCAASAADKASDRYPLKPTRIIVPFPPGGGTDFVTRAIAPPLGDALGQSVIIDNRSGAQGIVGTQIGAQANNDGHTLVVVDAATVIAPAMRVKAPFDVLKDFAPIGMLVEQPYLVTVHPSVPAKNLGEFLKLAQANPGSTTSAPARPSPTCRRKCSIRSRRSG
jgi:tripartite-type tricarboxylate transporter receptor subunit TctC